VGGQSVQFNRKRNFDLVEFHGRIKKQKSKEDSIKFYLFKRQDAAIPSFEFLRFDILLFCGSLFDNVKSHMIVHAKDSLEGL
jgi:hypothetical protein